MAQGARDWVWGILNSRHQGVIDKRMLRVEQHLHRPLDWHQGTVPAFKQILEWLDDDEIGLNLLDHCLGEHADSEAAKQLEDILDASGSAWTVGLDDQNQFQLERRVDATTAKAAKCEMEQSSNAAVHLKEAWSDIYRHKPNPSAGYRNAVRAIEAVCPLTVIPNDPKPTLGKVIAAMRLKPSKWKTEIGDVDTVIRMLEAVWGSQTDRHGSGEKNRPPNVTQREAEAALHLAVTLVQLFRTKAIRRA